MSHWVVLFASLIVLGIAAHFLVHSSVKIAKLFGVSELLIGLTLVSMGTSAPEVAVSVTAALNGQGALSVGNVIGSNIFNLGFILGLTALLMPQKIHRKLVYRDGAILFLVTLLVLFMVWNHFVGFYEGLVLLGCLVGYVSYLFVKKDLDLSELKEVEESVNLEPKFSKARQWGHVVIFAVSLYILVKASEYTVDSAVAIASSYGISEWAIGVTIVAAGTSLPEVATSIIAGLKKKFDIAIGNVIGSDIFNALGIIGISAVLAPLTLNGKTEIFGLPDFLFSQVMLVGTLLLTLFMLRTGWRLSRLEGGILLVIAVARMGFEIWVGA